MDKEIEVHIDNGMLLSFTQGEPAICDNMGKPGGWYTSEIS